MNDNLTQEEIIQQLQTLLHERGKEGLTLARKTILDEKIESKEVREALNYFINEYWYDVTRPALFSLVCEAVGGDPKKTTPIAVSIILISGAIDIHDDIIDKSENKEERLTVFGKFGKDIALLVGDALLFKGFTVLNEAVEKDVSAQKIAIIANIIKRTFFELGDAEALELQFRGRLNVTPEEYTHIVRKKAADVEAYTRISAILGNGSKEDIEAFAQYGRLLGMLAILRDDIIDMLDPEETIHRINKEHLSLAILFALKNPEMKNAISKLLNKKITKKEAIKLAKLVDNAGGFSSVNKYMQNLSAIAINRLENAKLNKNNLALLIKGMLLPNWRSYLSPE
jgi:geranylgeranyl pyrophosphate synthase